MIDEKDLIVCAEELPVLRAGGANLVFPASIIATVLIHQILVDWSVALVFRILILLLVEIAFIRWYANCLAKIAFHDDSIEFVRPLWRNTFKYNDLQSLTANMPLYPGHRINIMIELKDGTSHTFWISNHGTN